MNGARRRARTRLVNFIAFMLIGIFSFISVAAAGAPPKPKAPAPAKAGAPLSKYERAHLEALKVSAPGDRYFGRLKLSFLGINNTFRDSAISAGNHTTDSGIINKVNFADDALRDWAAKYPRDPELARTYFLAVKIEKKIWLKSNQERAWIYMNRIASIFPATYFGKIVKKDIAIGFTEHYYTDPLPCPTMPPTPEPTPALTTIPSAAPHGRGQAPPTATPEPAATLVPPATPAPAPTATTIAKGLKLQIEVPPCVPPATPAPSPTPTALATPPSAPSAPTTPASPPASAPPTNAPSVAAPSAPAASPKGR